VSVNRLGKGLKALIRSEEDQNDTGPIKTAVTEIALNDIHPNPNQPRKHFDKNALNELVASIKEKGLITPITVRRLGLGYELIAGERRWKAVKKTKNKTIPAYIVSAKSDAEIMEMALIENIQREDLNALEESNAYAILNSTYGMSHESIAKAVGKKRATISNSLRLLKLPPEIQNSLINGQISAGHARAILQMKDVNKILNFWKKIIEKDLSVRQSEALVKKSKIKKKVRPPSTNYQIKPIENKLIEILGTKVKIKPEKNGGVIEISYFSADELERIIDLIDSIN